MNDLSVFFDFRAEFDIYSCQKPFCFIDEYRDSGSLGEWHIRNWRFLASKIYLRQDKRARAVFGEQWKMKIGQS